jgi:ATP-dependent helicase/nuclease subunit B
MNLFNIPSNYGFLKTLTQFAKDKFSENPLSLSNLVILLPSRRSCNELKRIFLEQTKGEAIILPSIKAIGDIDYDDIILQKISLEYLQKFEEIIKPVSQIKYKIFLIKKILEWSKHQTISGNFSSLSVERAAILATELDKFLNEIKKEGLSLDNLNNLDEAEFAEHWQNILKFFSYFGKEWEGFLRDENIVSLYDRRIKMIELNSEFCKNNKPKNPIIIAGSSGSIKATSDFIKTVLQYDNCFVFLKGLDKNLDEKHWENIDSRHPQAKLKKLLEHLKINRNKVNEIFYEQFRLADDNINKILSFSMLPAEKTNLWQNKLDLLTSVSNISKIECKDNFEELNVVSIILRNHLENPNQTIALITGNQDFAKQVEQNLEKWNVEINNAFGNKLANTQTANYLFLLLNSITEEFSPLTFLSLLKHPFTLAGYEETEFRKLVKLFEDFVLRGKNNTKSFIGFFENLEKSDNLSSEEKYKMKISVKEKKELFSFITKLQTILIPLANNLDIKLPLVDLITLHIQTAENLASNSLINGKNSLWQNQKGSEEMQKFFEELIEEANNYGEIKVRDYPALLNYFLTEKSYSKKYEVHPAINILSPTEARLIDCDLFIITNLNEGKFPPHIAGDPWISKSMRKAFGLPPKEELIGTYAYEFTQYLSQKQVILTRAVKEEGGLLASKSRFMARLETFLKCQDIEIEEKIVWKEAAKQYAKPTKNIKIERPKPCPPVESRPKELGATKIEILLRNPYEIYAQKVLRLYKNDEIDEENGFIVFGKATHEILEKFALNYDNIQGDKLEYFIKLGNEIFDEYFVNEVSRELLKLRLKNIGNWFIEQEQKLREEGVKIMVEKNGKYKIPGRDFTITAKADRIEVDQQGDTDIIDYKTGTVPGIAKVQNGSAPQLAIEAYILQNGGFKEIRCDIANIKNLKYWKIDGKNEEPKPTCISNYIENLIKATEEGLIKLIIYFENPENPYIASAQTADDFNQKGKDYLHLSRVEEWNGN